MWVLTVASLTTSVGGDLARSTARGRSATGPRPPAGSARRAGSPAGARARPARGAGGREQAALDDRVEQRLVGGGGVNGAGDLGDARRPWSGSRARRRAARRGSSPRRRGSSARRSRSRAGPRGSAGSASTPSSLGIRRSISTTSGRWRAASRDRLLAVGRRGHRLDPRRGLQQRHQALADERLVVDDQHADRITHAFARTSRRPAAPAGARRPAAAARPASHRRRRPP